jgi:hypothetical protein
MACPGGSESFFKTVFGVKRSTLAFHNAGMKFKAHGLSELAFAPSNKISFATVGITTSHTAQTDARSYTEPVFCSRREEMELGQYSSCRSSKSTPEDVHIVERDHEPISRMVQGRMLVTFLPCQKASRVRSCSSLDMCSQHPLQGFYIHV